MNLLRILNALKLYVCNKKFMYNFDNHKDKMISSLVMDKKLLARFFLKKIQ